ncbi:hypothetical protein GRI62_13580 [Erythrobacter arachoides]|uniref:Uncharacterized protein n=1 Tax=Aurantiacibacter arachoides TaxID=1850444 RepID=A0A845A4M7_9SPHN|nr:hypothetical protein [Aurantiacibacter arachoides]MXO94630.1 hypothetical protein [Aurantiacibacter arachoides]GGD61979.1 hypothetical protein GCM10011411_22750 [Aurantiacibacter arachoides]
MARQSPLDDPGNSHHAWSRYKRLMRFMVAFSVVVAAIAMTYLYTQVENVSIHFYIATALGIVAAVSLMAALMGLVFLSSGTGHDEAVENSLDALDDQDAGKFGGNKR